MSASPGPPTVAIVGLGLMGASLALALRRSEDRPLILGVDTDPATVARAIERGVVEVADSRLEAVAGARLIVLAVPIRALRGLLPEVARVAGQAVVTDLASTKVEVIGWARSAGLDLVGGHPMCGREESGIEAADPGLYEGAAWALTRPQPEVEEIVRRAGANPFVVEAAEHDRLVGAISHAAFVLAAAYTLGVARRPDWERAAGLAGPGFRDMTRLAGGDPEMYLGIAETNREAILDSLASVQGELDRLRRHLEAGDPRLVELFEEARGARRRWARERERAGGRPAAG